MTPGVRNIAGLPADRRDFATFAVRHLNVPPHLGRAAGEPGLTPAAPGPAIVAKQKVLTELGAMLSVLADKLQSQQDTAVDICDLSTQVEQFAQAARKLAFASPAEKTRALTTLSTTLASFAAETEAIIQRAGRDALLGQAVADALYSHAKDLTALANDMQALPDAAAVRARLRPLAQTLVAVPERLKASESNTEDLALVAVRAADFAARSASLAERPQGDLRDVMIGLSRELADFSHLVAAISTKLSRDAAIAVQAAKDMAGRTQNIAAGRAPQDRVVASLGDVIEAGRAAQQRTLGPAAAPPAGPAIAWAIGGRRPG